MGSKFKGKQPEDLFLEIHKRCEKLGISPEEFSELSAVKKLKPKKGSGVEKILFWCLAVLVSVCALTISLGTQPFTQYFGRIWFFVRGFEVENEMCIFDMPPGVQNMFMPPFDCAACRNLTQVEKVTNISPEEFEDRFAYSNVPVIVSDGAANWTAMDTFSFDFFRRLYLENDDGKDGDWECQFFPYQTEFFSLYEVMKMSPERAKEPWYIGWSNCDSKVGSILRKHYRRPYFLPLQSESVNVDWIFMGTPGYGAKMHIDHVHNPSWQAQIKGNKLWTLEPPPECYSECRTIEAVVNPGEVIVLDTNRWYHQTLIIGDDLSITIGSEFD